MGGKPEKFSPRIGKNPSWPIYGSNAGINQDIVDDRITHFAIHIAQLVFALTVNRDAEGNDAINPRLP